MLAEMLSERLQIAGYWTWLAGLGVAGVGIILQRETLVRCGAIFLAASLALFAMNAGKILSHLFHPVLKPFPLPVRE